MPTRLHAEHRNDGHVRRLCETPAVWGAEENPRDIRALLLSGPGLWFDLVDKVDETDHAAGSSQILSDFRPFEPANGFLRESHDKEARFEPESNEATAD